MELGQTLIKGSTKEKFINVVHLIVLRRLSVSSTDKLFETYVEERRALKASAKWVREDLTKNFAMEV